MELKMIQRNQLQYPERDFEIVPTIPPEEMARRVKLAFKRMPEESALVVFAKVMTSDVPHGVKVAVWDAVRYSHIWWHVDEVLKGDVMENPIVQCAFGDAVAMRCWRVDKRMPNWHDTLCATNQSWSKTTIGGPEVEIPNVARRAIMYVTRCRDDVAAKFLRELQGKDEVRNFVDFNGNNLLWYLTYRDDQQSEGGFACPKTAKELIDLGVDPNHRNKLGLSWNDVARHVNRPE